MTTEDQLLTVLELASYLRIGRRKAYLLVQAGQVPSIRVGSSYRIPRAALNRWLENALQPRRTAASLPVTEEMIEDAPATQSYIHQRLVGVRANGVAGCG